MKSLLAPAALVLLVIAAYWATPENSFHFDDIENIVRHEPVRMDEFSVAALVDAGKHSYLSNRSIPSVTFALDWWRGGGQPRAFLQTNVLLHTVTALLVMWFYILLAEIGGLTPRRAIVPLSALLAVLWAIHPINSTPVNYAVQRMVILAALFMLLSLIAYLKARRCDTKRRYLWWALALASAACAAYSKENAWILPVLILGVEYGVLRHNQPLVQRHWDRYLLVLPFMVAIWVAFDVAILSGPLHDYFSAGYRFRSFTLEERLLTQPRVVWFYLSQFALPLPGRFSIEHDFVLSSGLLSPPSTLVAIGGLAVWLVVGLGLLARLRIRLIGFLMLWPLATLAIESSFVPLEMVFEHRMYIPTIGLLGLVGVAVSRVHWQHRWLPGVAILAGVVVVLLMVSTGERNQVWRSSLSLQEDALRNAPNSSRVWRNYGFYAYQAGEIDKARSAAERSLALHGMNAHAHELMGIILLDKGDLERAQWHLDMALRAEPENESFLNHRGEIALQQGQYAEAEKMFRAAVARAGWNPVYYWNLALAYEGTGACSSAKEAWRTYLSLEPSASDRQLVEEHLDSEYASPSGTCYRQ